MVKLLLKRCLFTSYESGLSMCFLSVRGQHVPSHFHLQGGLSTSQFVILLSIIFNNIISSNNSGSKSSISVFMPYIYITLVLLQVLFSIKTWTRIKLQTSNQKAATCFLLQRVKLPGSPLYWSWASNRWPCRVSDLPALQPLPLTGPHALPKSFHTCCIWKGFCHPAVVLLRYHSVSLCGPDTHMPVKAHTKLSLKQPVLHFMCQFTWPSSLWSCW